MAKGSDGAATAMVMGVVFAGTGVWLSFGPHVLGYYLLAMGALFLIVGMVGANRP